MENKNENRFSFMTNIYVPSHDRTIYSKFLDKFTMDGQVTYIRLLLGGAMGVILSTFIIYIMFKDMDKLKFVWLPYSLMIISILLFVLVIMMNSRNESMVSTLIKLQTFKYAEKIDRKGKRVYTDLFIQDIDESGVLRFKDNTIGVIYEIEGVLSSSTLPTIVRGLHEVKRRYLVTRRQTSKETQLLKIKHINLDRIMENLTELGRKASKNDKLTDNEKAWVGYMAGVQNDFLERYHMGREYKMSQYLILTEENEKDLNQAIDNLRNFVNEGLYSRSRRLSSEAEIIEVLSEATMLSKRGVFNNVKEIEEEKENRKFNKQ